MGSLGGSHTVEIDAPLGRCFEIAADIEGAPRWQGAMKDVEVHERDAHGRPTVVTTIADAKVRRSGRGCGSPTPRRTACPGSRRRATSSG